MTATDTSRIQTLTNGGHRRKSMKIEQKLDAEFARLGVKPYIYHFTDVEVLPFKAITFAVPAMGMWLDLRRLLLENFDAIMSSHNPVQDTLEFLKMHGLHGIAICSMLDPFSRQRGRVIAKGRLLKHLRQEEAEKEYPTIVSPTVPFANHVEYGRKER
jgi:hypothetical protein